MREPVLQRFGGAKGVSRLSFRLNDLVLASDRLRPHFERMDALRMVEHQASLVISALTGRPACTEAELADLHSRMEIGAAEFDEMAALLAQAIRAEGHPEGEADRAVAHFRRLQDRLAGSIGGGSPAAA